MFGVIHARFKRFLLMESAKTENDVVANEQAQIYVQEKERVGITTVEIHLRIAKVLIAEISIREALAQVEGACNKCYVVSWSQTKESGWGPLLYDLALEFAGQSGLAPDRTAVSDEAEAVWLYYMKNRPNIKWKQLDDEFGTLTPGIPEDDCSQVSARRRTPEKTPKDKKWVDSPLSKVYYKTDAPILKLLTKHGKITDARGEKNDSAV